jgi:hypothetical protein
VRPVSVVLPGSAAPWVVVFVLQVVMVVVRVVMSVVRVVMSVVRVVMVVVVIDLGHGGRREQCHPRAGLVATTARRAHVRPPLRIESTFLGR